MIERIVNCRKCAEISCSLGRGRSRRIKYACLSQFAPFFIKKEKCSRFASRIQLRNKYWAAEIVAKHIKSQRRLGLSVQVSEKVIGVEILIAEVFPRRSVEVPATRLSGHIDLSRIPETGVDGGIRSLDLKFVN